MKVISKMVIFSVMAVFCFSVSSGYGETGKGKLRISVTGAVNNNGTINLALFNSGNEYLSKKGTPFMKVKAPISSNQAEIELTDVPFGEYAIKVYHDENGNGLMDKNFMGIPKEDYAFSNNAAGTFGPPSYDKVKFNFNKNGMTLEIKMTSAE